MKKVALLALIFIFAGPMELPAFRDHRPAVKPLDSGSPVFQLSPGMRGRLKVPIRHAREMKHLKIRGRAIRPAHKPGKHSKPGHDRPGYYRPFRTTVVRESQPIIIINNPPPTPPPPVPEPERIYVPPVMDTRTEPGYWDHGIKKRWMGDHWRYEQDFEIKTWVPATQVEYVKQEGYWTTVETPRARQ
jgi:hypothetical protein